MENPERTLSVLSVSHLMFVLFFWYNKQGKGNEVNSVRFKEFLTNEQCLTMFCFENVNL